MASCIIQGKKNIRKNINRIQIGQHLSTRRINCALFYEGKREELYSAASMAAKHINKQVMRNSNKHQMATPAAHVHTHENYVHIGKEKYKASATYQLDTKR